MLNAAIIASNKRRVRSPQERFWRHVRKTDGCWWWMGAKKPTGYGNFFWGPQCMLAHRASFVLHGGILTGNQQVDHLCSNPSCVRPDHLRAVTPSENILSAKHHWNRNKTHCIRGHEFTPENTSFHSITKARCCRACRREKHEH